MSSTASFVTAESPLELTILMPCLNEAETLAHLHRQGARFLDAQRHRRRGRDRRQRQHRRLAGDRRGAGRARRPRAAQGYGARPASAASTPRAAATSSWATPTTATTSATLDALRRAAARRRPSWSWATASAAASRPGAMPPLHRYLGNPVLSFIGRLFFRSPCGDFHCGLRGFRRDAIRALDLQSAGHGVRQRDGRQGDAAPAAHRRGADHPLARRPLPPAAPAQLARRLAAPALPAALQPALAVLLPRLALCSSGLLMAWLVPGPRPSVAARSFDVQHAALRRRRAIGIPDRSSSRPRQGLRHRGGLSTPTRGSTAVFNHSTSRRPADRRALMCSASPWRSGRWSSGHTGFGPLPPTMMR